MIINVNVEKKSENISFGLAIGEGRTSDGRRVEISQSGIYLNFDITQEDLLVHQYRLSLKDIIQKIIEAEPEKEKANDKSKRKTKR